MGDFERTFGAGADACSIIDRYSRDFIREQKEEWQKEKRASKFESHYDRSLGIEIYFQNYDEMNDWDLQNPKAQYVRRRRGPGYEMKIISK